MPLRLRLTVLTVLLLVCEMSSRSGPGEGRAEEGGDEAGAAAALHSLAMDALDHYAFPLGQLCIAFIYGLYRRFTILNMTLFLVKYVPTVVYMYKMLKSFYNTSRERIKQKQTELEDIQLQIRILNTKMCVRDAEFSERAEQLRRGAERLRAVRARVRDMIAADEALRRALDSAAPWGDEPDVQLHSTSEEAADEALRRALEFTAPWGGEHDIHLHSTPEQEHDFIITLLKELKSAEQVVIPECQPEKMDCGEHIPSDEPPNSENSVYSSLSDADAKQDCRVKIVKVTNVYKIAYLKHFIKQKRLRRATQQALLKKKIEGIKKLLESWQKSLNMVINSKILTPRNMASQEAMGDYSKPNLRESSDSDSDLRNSGTDTFNDDFTTSFNWTQNPYKPFGYNYEDGLESPTAKDVYDAQEYNEIKHSVHTVHMCECNRPKISRVLFQLPEETNSQVAIEEIKSDASVEYESECRDIIAI